MIIVHAPEAASDVKARRSIVGKLADFALVECETLPKSPFVIIGGLDSDTKMRLVVFFAPDK